MAQNESAGLPRHEPGLQSQAQLVLSGELAEHSSWLSRIVNVIYFSPHFLN